MLHTPNPDFPAAFRRVPAESSAEGRDRQHRLHHLAARRERRRQRWRALLAAVRRLTKAKAGRPGQGRPAPVSG